MDHITSLESILMCSYLAIFLHLVHYIRIVGCGRQRWLTATTIGAPTTGAGATATTHPKGGHSDHRQPPY